MSARPSWLKCQVFNHYNDPQKERPFEHLGATFRKIDCCVPDLGSGPEISAAAARTTRVMTISHADEYQPAQAELAIPQ